LAMSLPRRCRMKCLVTTACMGCVFLLILGCATMVTDGTRTETIARAAQPDDHPIVVLSGDRPDLPYRVIGSVRVRVKLSESRGKVAPPTKLSQYSGESPSSGCNALCSSHDAGCPTGPGASRSHGEPVHHALPHPLEPESRPVAIAILPIALAVASGLVCLLVWALASLRRRALDGKRLSRVHLALVAVSSLALFSGVSFVFMLVAALGHSPHPWADAWPECAGAFLVLVVAPWIVLLFLVRGRRPRHESASERP
jgi:hypothetical protein